jgi:hypothetical protein
LVIITDDFFLRDPQIAKEEIDINGTIPINKIFKIFYVFLLYYLEFMVGLILFTAWAQRIDGHFCL